MRQASTDTLPSPVTVKRYPWMRRFDFYSPKAQRRLTLFSHATLSLWTVLESRPSIIRFCEYPGYVLVNGERVIADFWAEDRDSAQSQFLVIPDGLRVEPESPRKARLYASAQIDLVRPERLEPYAVWIRNWFQINPYLAANSRFVTRQMLDQVRAALSHPLALYELDYALRNMDTPLVRTALFMLLHQGEVTSEDLMRAELSGATTFQLAWGSVSP